MPVKKRATINDVAALAGVSIKSISRAINNEPGMSQDMHQRIVEAMRQLNYVPNPVIRGMRGTSSVVGIVVDELDDYVGQIVHGISQVARQLHFSLVLYTDTATYESADDYLPLIGSGLVGGLLMIIPRYYETLVDLCNKYSLPFVFIDYYLSNFPKDTLPTITTTNRKGILDAMRHLLALGHREIGFITGMMDLASAQERLQGYKDGLSEVGLPFDPSLVAAIDQWPTDDFEQINILLSRRPHPTAIIAWDDLTAIRTMSAIRKLGLEVGDDISVVGFDDIPSASLVYPSLTTIRQPMAQMGAAAMELLAAQLKGLTPTPLHREFPTELIVRESTRPPKKLGSGK